MKKYRIKRRDRASIDLGETVYCYGFMGCDYGCSSDDSRAFGVEHESVTLKPDGTGPFFTIPKDDISEERP